MSDVYLWLAGIVFLGLLPGLLSELLGALIRPRRVTRRWLPRHPARRSYQGPTSGLWDERASDWDAVAAVHEAERVMGVRR